MELRVRDEIEKGSASAKMEVRVREEGEKGSASAKWRCEYEMRARREV